MSTEKRRNHKKRKIEITHIGIQVQKIFPNNQAMTDLNKQRLAQFLTEIHRKAYITSQGKYETIITYLQTRKARTNLKHNDREIKQENQKSYLFKASEIVV